MANTNAPFGFREFTGTLGGVAPNFSMSQREIAYDDSSEERQHYNSIRIFSSIVSVRVAQMPGRS